MRFSEATLVLAVAITAGTNAYSGIWERDATHHDLLVRDAQPEDGFNQFFARDDSEAGTGRIQSIISGRGGLRKEVDKDALSESNSPDYGLDQKYHQYLQKGRHPSRESNAALRSRSGGIRSFLSRRASPPLTPPRGPSGPLQELYGILPQSPQQQPSPPQSPQREPSPPQSPEKEPSPPQSPQRQPPRPHSPDPQSPPLSQRILQPADFHTPNNQPILPLTAPPAVRPRRRVAMRRLHLLGDPLGDMQPRSFASGDTPIGPFWHPLNPGSPNTPLDFHPSPGSTAANSPNHAVTADEVGPLSPHPPSRQRWLGRPPTSPGNPGTSRSSGSASPGGNAGLSRRDDHSVARQSGKIPVAGAREAPIDRHSDEAAVAMEEGRSPFAPVPAFDPSRIRLWNHGYTIPKSQQLPRPPQVGQRRLGFKRRAVLARDSDLLETRNDDRLGTRGLPCSRPQTTSSCVGESRPNEPPNTQAGESHTTSDADFRASRGLPPLRIEIPDFDGAQMEERTRQLRREGTRRTESPRLPHISETGRGG